MAQKPKIMTKMMMVIEKAGIACGILALVAGSLALVAGSFYGSYRLDEYLFEKHSQKYNVLHVGNDVSRSCLAQCKDKAVERFFVQEGKLKCECSKVKNTQKRQKTSK